MSCQQKPYTQSAKSSGLLAMLPRVKTAPISNTSFIPNSVKNKNIPSKAANQHKGLFPHNIKKMIKTSKDKKAAVLKLLEQANTSDDSEIEEDHNIPDTYDDEMWEKVCGRSKTKPIAEEPTTSSNQTEPVKIEMKTLDIAPEPEKVYDGLDNETFKQLAGKCKKPMGNIKLIDINEDEMLPDKETWLTKSLTDPEMAPKSNVENPVDPTRRRKHHITYLAQQAKSNEQDLKNAWAASKNNRLMSRAKYGF